MMAYLENVIINHKWQLSKEEMEEKEKKLRSESKVKKKRKKEQIIMTLYTYPQLYRQMNWRMRVNAHKNTNNTEKSYTNDKRIKKKKSKNINSKLLISPEDSENGSHYAVLILIPTLYTYINTRGDSETFYA